MNNHKGGLALAIAVVLLIVAAFLLPSMPNANAAPAAAVTPIAAQAGIGPSQNPRLVEFFNMRSLTADTLSPCLAVGDFTKADLYYNIDIGSTQRVTLTTRAGNMPGLAVAQLSAAANKSADAADLTQFAVYGQYMCVYAELDTTAAVSLTVNAWVK